MLVREGDERSRKVDLWLACTLAAVAGALNAAAFYAVGFFSANMTGNISALSDHLALRQWATAVFYFAILIAFIVGAACSATIIDAGRPWTRRIYAYAIMVEALMLACVGGADLGLVKDWRTPVVMLGLAYAMGFQNAVSTRISGSRVRTTHISGLATDIGIEIAAAIDSLGRRRVERVRPRVLAKLQLQACTVLSFLTGGVIGVLLYRTIGGYLMILTAFALFGIAASAISRSRYYDFQTIGVVGD